MHEESYEVECDPDGTLRFRRPDGRAVPDVPPRPTPPDDAVRAHHARHAAAGVEIGPRTGVPGWLGEDLDVGWAIDVLHPRAAEPGDEGRAVTE